MSRTEDISDSSPEQPRTRRSSRSESIEDKIKKLSIQKEKLLKKNQEDTLTYSLAKLKLDSIIHKIEALETDVQNKSKRLKQKKIHLHQKSPEKLNESQEKVELEIQYLEKEIEKVYSKITEYVSKPIPQTVRKPK